MQSELVKEVTPYAAVHAAIAVPIPIIGPAIGAALGAGKTRTAIELVCEQLNKFSGTVVWLAHSEELCEHAIQTFQDI